MNLESKISLDKTFPYVGNFCTTQVQTDPYSIRLRGEGAVLDEYYKIPGFEKSFEFFDSGLLVRQLTKNVLDFGELRKYILFGLTKDVAGSFTSGDSFVLQFAIEPLNTQKKDYIMSAQIVNTSQYGEIHFLGFPLRNFRPSISVKNVSNHKNTQSSQSKYHEFQNDILISPKERSSFKLVTYLDVLIRDMVYLRALEMSFNSLEFADFQFDQTDIQTALSYNSSLQLEPIHQSKSQTLCRYTILMRPKRPQKSVDDTFIIEGHVNFTKRDSHELYKI